MHTTFPQFFSTQDFQPKHAMKEGETDVKMQDLHVLGILKIASADDCGKSKSNNFKI